MTQAYDAAHPIGGEPFQVGRTLSRIFDVYWRGIGKFTLLACTFLIPILLIKLGAAALLPAQQRQLVVGLATLALLPLWAIIHGACALGAFKLLNGEGFEAGPVFGAAARRFWPMIGAGICVGLAAGLGFLLLFVPGVIVFLMFYVAGAACVVEKTGVFDSLRRSRELTKDYRWRILGVVFVFMLVALAILIPFAVVAAAVIGLAGGVKAVAGAKALVGLPFVILSVNEFVFSAITYTFGAVVVGVIYHDLRVAKEGVNVGRLTEVFD